MNLERLVCITDVQNLRTIDSEVGISSDHQLNPKFIFQPGELMQIHLTRLSKIKAYFTFSGRDNIILENNETRICLTRV